MINLNQHQKSGFFFSRKTQRKQNLRNQVSFQITDMNGLLLLWIVVGAGLRLINLDLKSPATIEIATLVFSLGNSVAGVPVDQVISLDGILQPLRLNLATDFTDVFERLMTESTHPPLYFWLNHWWLELWGAPGQLVSLWSARLLAVFWGVLSIPVIFYLSLKLFESRIIAHLAAILLAVSPYGVFIAQQARHYTLPVFLILLSLGCLIKTVERLTQNRSVPVWLGIVWMIINSVGFATHYFFGIAILAEGLVILPILWQQTLQGIKSQDIRNVCRLVARYHGSVYLAMMGTLSGCLIWLPFIDQAAESELTDWIYDGKSFLELLEPIPRLLAWLITMFTLLPVEGVPGLILGVSATVLGILSVWALVILGRGCRHQWHHFQPQRNLKTLLEFLGAVFLIFLSLIYGVGADLSLAARYQFVYFPAIILLIAISLSVYWQAPQKLSQFFRFWQFSPQLGIIDANSRITGGTQVIFLIVLMGFVGSLTVVFNFGFQTSQRSDLLVPQILQVQEEQKPGVPVLMAMVQKTHAETRSLIELAWEFQEVSTRIKIPADEMNQPLPPLNFLLAHKEEDSGTATETLHQTINQLPKPLDLWTINFKSAVNPEQVNCVEDPQPQPDINGYDYDLYHCY